MDITKIIIISGISFLSILILNALAPRLGLIDIPDERKAHAVASPLVGGLAVYLATLFACIAFLPMSSLTIQLFLVSGGLIVLLGAFDDHGNLGVPIRLASQICITAILVFYSGSYLHYLGDILSIGNIDLGAVGILFTFVATLSLINAFNWTDGIDGLAGSLALNTFVSIAILFELSNVRLSGGGDLDALPLILSAGIVPFLFFNLGLVPGPVKKVFMGDAGSMFFGLCIIWLFVEGTQGDEPSFRPVTAVWIVALPLWDLTSTFYRRIRSGSSPFKAGRDHLHHLLLNLGIGARQSLAIVFVVSVVVSAVGVLGEYYQVAEYTMLAIYVGLFFIYHFLLSALWGRTTQWEQAKA